MIKKKIDLFTFPVLFVLLLPFFKPALIGNYGTLNSIFLLWKIISIIIIVYVSRSSYYFTKNDIYIGSLILFFIIYLFNNFVNKCNVIELINTFVSILTLILFIRFLVQKKQYYLLLKVLAFISLIICFLQFVSIFVINIQHFLINDNTVPTYLLGPDNYSAFFMIPMITIILFYDTTKTNGKVSKLGWSVLIIYTLTNIYMKSMTAAAVGAIYIILILIYKKNMKFLEYLSLKNLLLVFMLLLILIIVFDIQNIFSMLLENFLGKGTTLNSRTIIWDLSLEQIKNNIFFGCGDFSNYDLFQNYVLYGTTHAHNMLLELLLRTGLIGTICYLHFLYYTIERKFKQLCASSGYILVIGMVAFIVLSFMDFYINIPMFYCLIILIYYQENILKKSN